MAKLGSGSYPPTNSYYRHAVYAGGGNLRTDSQMRSQDFITELGTPFVNEYAFDNFELNNGYPILKRLDYGYPSGEGTESQPYLISTPVQLRYVAYLVTNLNSLYGDKYYALTADIELNNTENWDNWHTSPPENIWTPIGSPSNPFNGTFDGRGYTISGIYIRTLESYQGLFSYINTGGTVKNLNVEKSYIKGDSNPGHSQQVGGITGVNKGTIFNCSNSATVDAIDDVGGIAGRNEGGTITDCFNTGSIKAWTSFGGIVGRITSGNVSRCYSTGSIHTSGSDRGAIVGIIYGSGTISDSYYLEGSTPSPGEGNVKSLEAFTGGEVAYLLQGEGDVIWGHTILDGSEYPRLSALTEGVSAVIKLTFTDAYHETSIDKYTLSGDTVAVPNITARAGYTSCWKNGSGTIITSDTIFNSDETITAEFTPRTDTQYIVEHYLQNIDDDNYSLFDTEELYGTTDTEVTADAIIGSGFYENTLHEDRIASGIVDGDGSLVLKLYYYRETYDITVDGDFFTVFPVEGSSSPVRYMGSYSFTITIDDAYNKSDITVRINGDVITATGGVYTIEDIGEDIEITVEGITINTYTVILPSGAGFTLEAEAGIENPVDYDGSFSFTITIHGSHSQSVIIVKTDGIVLTPSGGIYAVENIRDDIEITIEGVEINTYTVTFNGNEGTYVSGDEIQTVEHGSPAIAPVYEREGYDLVGWSEEFDEVTSTLTVLAQWELQTFTVTLPSGDGFTAEATPGSESPVNYDGSFSFIITIHNSHSESVITVKVNGFVITPFEGVYTIDNITENQEITIEGIEINTYTVTFNGDGGILESGDEIQIVEYGSAAIAPQYERRGYYFLGWSMGFNNITSDVTVTATWELRTYMIVFTDEDIVMDYIEFDVESGTITLSEPAEKEGYIFQGWYSSSDFSGEPITIIEEGTAEDITLYAKWEPISTGLAGWAIGIIVGASVLAAGALVFLLFKFVFKKYSIRKRG